MTILEVGQCWYEETLEGGVPPAGQFQAEILWVQNSISGQSVFKFLGDEGISDIIYSVTWSLGFNIL